MRVSIWFKNGTKGITVVDVDELSWCGDLGEVFLRQRSDENAKACWSTKGADVVKPKKFIVARFAVLFICGDCEFMTRLDGDLKQASVLLVNRDRRICIHLFRPSSNRCGSLDLSRV